MHMWLAGLVKSLTTWCSYPGMEVTAKKIVLSQAQMIYNCVKVDELIPEIIIFHTKNIFQIKQQSYFYLDIEFKFLGLAKKWCPFNLHQNSSEESSEESEQSRSATSYL